MPFRKKNKDGRVESATLGEVWGRGIRGSCWRGSCWLCFLPGPRGDREGKPSEEAEGDFDDEAGGAAEGGAEGGFEGLFVGAFFDEFGDPGGKEGAENRADDSAEQGEGGADEGAGDGAGDGGPGGGFAGAESLGADQAAGEFEEFSDRQDRNDNGEDGGGGVQPVGVPGEGEGEEGDEPVAGEGEDVEGDAEKGDKEHEGVEGEIEHAGDCSGVGIPKLKTGVLLRVSLPPVLGVAREVAVGFRGSGRGGRGMGSWRGCGVRGFDVRSGWGMRRGCN